MKKQAIGRRGFLKGAGAVGAALGASPGAPAAAQQTASSSTTPPPNLAAETLPPAPDTQQQTSSGGDFMVDVLKQLGIEYVTQTPANTFRGLHEAIINHGGNKSPELLSCTHEEIAVAMAHGYVKIEGKPLAVLAQSTVGLQHAAMALYNACPSGDRTKSTYSSAACGCGAFFATPIPCGRATTGAIRLDPCDTSVVRMCWPASRAHWRRTLPKVRSMPSRSSCSPPNSAMSAQLNTRRKARPLAALACLPASLLDGRWLGDQRPRESPPLFVWFTIGLMFVCGGAYIIGYMALIE